MGKPQPGNGLVAAVTGATSGLGKACALALAEAGYRVYGTGRHPSRDPSLAPGFLEMLPLDVTDDASVRAFATAVLEKEGKVDVLVTCAGMGIAGSIEDTPIHEADRQMETNFMGTVRTVKAFLPAMRKGRQGRIIVFGSIAGRVGMPFQAFYSSSKAALAGFVEALRHEVRAFGIQACIVEPGDFSTGFTDARVVFTGASGGAYDAACDSILRVVEKDERTGADPALAGKLVVSLATRRRMPVRVCVGSMFQRFAAVAKGVLPAAWFEVAFRIVYRLEK